MSERKAFERILASLNEAALDRTRWSAATGLIDDALRTHGSCMVFGDGTSDEDVRIYFAWCIMRGQRHPELERAYFEDYWRRANGSRGCAFCPTADCSITPNCTPRRS